MRMAEAPLWVAVQQEAEKYLSISEELFWNEFGQDEACITRRCFLFTDPEDHAMGTISGWYDEDFRDMAWGRTHWLAIHPAYQGGGLAKPAMTFAMNALAQWNDRCYLVTSTARLPALKVYLDFGFLPDLEPEGSYEAWQGVLTNLAHPLLRKALDK
jgi:GNAT superfamily N-acetyltransferase